MPIQQNDETKKPEIVKMFRQSIAPYSKKLVSLHPHLYASLYRRASEMQALHKIVSHLQEAEVEAKQQKYTKLPFVLNTIKDALHGHPPLSWWNLFTTTLGYAFGGLDDEAKNIEEAKYLQSISKILTDLIRNYQSSNTKLLLDIRLTALEVDARLVELEKIPKGIQETNETLDYLVSEFQLLIQQLKEVAAIQKETNGENHENLGLYIRKVNQLMEIAQTVKQTDLGTFLKFSKQNHIEKLETAVKNFLQSFSLEEKDLLQSWTMNQLVQFLELFNNFPDLLAELPPKEFCGLLQRADQVFVEDPSLEKERPEVFFSDALKNYVKCFAEICKEQNKELIGMAKNAKTNASISKDIVELYKNYYATENDLHHICSLVHFKDKKLELNGVNPEKIQKEIISRLITLTNLSQPKDLDALLKTFTEEEKEERYFLIQEIVLEQFIRWRKLGIY